MIARARSLFLCVVQAATQTPGVYAIGSRNAAIKGNAILRYLCVRDRRPRDDAEFLALIAVVNRSGQTGTPTPLTDAYYTAKQATSLNNEFGLVADASLRPAFVRSFAAPPSQADAVGVRRSAPELRARAAARYSHV